MKVMLVPSSVSGCGEQPCQYLISYLINDTVAIDAGSLGIYCTPATQAKVKHVFVSHTHNDHTATLPIFLENAYEGHSDCVTLHGSAAVLDALQTDMFNGRTWPDFIAISREVAPFLKLHTLEPEQTLEIEGLRITPIPVDHLVPTLGFLIEDETSTVLIASDTGPTELLWKYANAARRLDAVFLEASFPNAMGSLAQISMHLTPELFAREVDKLTRPTTVVAVHMKARFRSQILDELERLNLPSVLIGEPGKVYEW